MIAVAVVVIRMERIAVVLMQSVVVAVIIVVTWGVWVVVRRVVTRFF